jgi:hypothetical protein
LVYPEDKFCWIRTIQIMKKRYLFPLMWLLIEISILVIPVLFPIAYIFSIPSMLIVNLISDSLGGPVDTYYLVVFVTFIQFFLLGYLWDFIVEKIRVQNFH